MKYFIILACVAITLGGCSTLKKITGQQNDTVLPGQREDILGAEQQTAKNPNVMGKLKPACDPNVSICPTQPPAPVQ